MSALRSGHCRPGIIPAIVVAVLVIARSTHSAPVQESDSTQVAEYDGAGGCYYNFQHYQEGARIITNEPCLNCTCHNRMLMCYLRVCPFTKAIGQDCTVEKRPDQCCPVITCPEVPVQLLTSTTSSPSKSDSTGLVAPGSTDLGFPDSYGCSVNERFYADGAQLPVDSNNPCELCYCIRNKTTCLMQQCTLSVAGCRPVYQPGICCPVKYNCEYDEVHETSIGTTPGLIMTTTVAPHPATPPKCRHEDKMYEDGELIYTIQPCQHCYCFHGEIVCAVQECGKPMESHKKNCTALPPLDGECCPTTYLCEDDLGNIATEIPEVDKKIQESTEPSESFPGADNAIPENPSTQKAQTASPLGNEVPESEPTKSTVTEKTTDETSTLWPESVKSEDIDDKPEIATQRSEETLPHGQSSESPTIIEDNDSKLEMTTPSAILDFNEELTTPVKVEKSSEIEQQLTNVIVTEKSSEQSTEPSIKNEKIEPVEPGIEPTELPMELTTVLSREAEKSSESSSPVSDKNTENNDATQNVEISSEEIKNKQTKESNVEPTFETTLAPSIDENAISNSGESKSDEINPSVNIESSTIVQEEGSKSEEIELATTPESSIVAINNETIEKDHSNLDISTEISENTDKTASSEASSSADEEVKTNETTVPETSTIQIVGVDSSTAGIFETEAAESSETSKVHPTVPSAGQENYTEEKITSPSPSSETDKIITSNVDESSTESHPIEGIITENDSKESEIPLRGPTGIPIPERVPEHKAEDKDAVTDNIVTEGYIVSSSGMPHNIDNLQTDRPENEPTTYFTPIDSKTENHRLSTPSFEESLKEMTEIPSDGQGSVETSSYIPEKEKSDSESLETKIPELANNEPISSTKLPTDDLTIKEVDSSSKSTEEATPAYSSTEFEEEKIKSEQEVSNESTTIIADEDDHTEIPVKDESEENKIDENSKETPLDKPEIENIPENSHVDQDLDESFTTVSSELTSKKSQDPIVVKPTESSEITRSPAFSEPSTQTPSTNELETKVSESSTEQSIDINSETAEIVSDRLADEKQKENKLPADSTIKTEIRETSTTPFTLESSTEISSAETKLNDQETSNQASTTAESDDSDKSHFPGGISTTPSSHVSTSDRMAEDEVKKEEELITSTETAVINQTPEIELITPEIRPSHGIPGEGNCLVDGQSYSNNSAIPPANACQVSCRCVSSIVQCELIQCSAPPGDLSNCTPMYSGPGACCPMYACDSTPSVELQAGNQMSGGEILTTPKSLSEEPANTEKATAESSTKSESESASEELELNEKEISPISPVAGETVSSSIPSESSFETTLQPEHAEKPAEDPSSSPVDGKNDIDQETVDSTTESIQKTPEEPSKQSTDSISNVEHLVTSESPKLDNEVETESITVPVEKFTPPTVSAEEELLGQSNEPTESSGLETSSDSSILEINQTEKINESEVRETTVISIEPTEKDIQKVTSDYTLVSSTEKLESTTSSSHENLTEQEPEQESETTGLDLPADAGTENSSSEKTIAVEEPITTAPIASDHDTFTPEVIEPVDSTTTTNISEQESNKSDDAESEKTKEPEISTESQPIDTSTDAVFVNETERESSSPSTVSEIPEESFKVPEAAPTTAIPSFEGEITTIPNSSESLSEEPSTDKKDAENQFLDEKPHHEVPTIKEPVPEVVVETEISTEKSDESPKESSTEVSKESNKESQSTTPKLNEFEKINPTEQSIEIADTTEKLEVQEPTEATENKVPNADSNVTEGSKISDSTSAVEDKPSDSHKDIDSPKESEDESSEDKHESTSSPVKPDEEFISQESLTTPESVKIEDQTSETLIESSSEPSISSEKYPSTEATISEISPSSSTSNDKSEETSPSEKPEVETSSVVPHGIQEQSGTKAPEEPVIAELPDANSNEDGPIDLHPIDDSTVTDSHGEDEHRPMDTYTTTIHPDTSRPHTRPPYPDQMVPETPETDDQNIFPPDGADIKNQFQPEEGDTEDYDDQAVYGPGTCRYGGKIYMSAQQIPRDDACDFCFCFRSDIICLQQSCPPPIPGCHEEPIGGFCCPRYECPVSMATSLNVTTTTTTTTTVPPHFLSHAYRGSALRGGCQIGNRAYRVGEDIKSKSGPCMGCTCGGDGKMKCNPRACSASPTLKEMIAHAAAKKRRR